MIRKLTIAAVAVLSLGMTAYASDQKPDLTFGRISATVPHWFAYRDADDDSNHKNFVCTAVPHDAPAGFAKAMVGLLDADKVVANVLLADHSDEMVTVNVIGTERGLTMNYYGSLAHCRSDAKLDPDRRLEASDGRLAKGQ